VKVLLLGAGESGKSTILKQMKLLYAWGFSMAERKNYRRIIFSNIISSLRVVLEVMVFCGFTFEREGNKRYTNIIFLDRKLAIDEQLPVEYITPFKSLWADQAVQSVIKRGNEFALHDNLSYYFQDIDRLFAEDYIPDDQDILCSRFKTTGIVETTFDLGSYTCRMFDVGGQRSERKKWIHCFENVNCLLFVVAISGYDQALLEDREGNQMQEALILFESMANSRWFIRTALILFLNKMDLFKRKLESSPISKYFYDYEGDCTNLDVASKFFQNKFLGLNRNPDKEVYTHFTHATNTSLLKITMASVQDMVIRRSLNTMCFV